MTLHPDNSLRRRSLDKQNVFHGLRLHWIGIAICLVIVGGCKRPSPSEADRAVQGISAGAEEVRILATAGSNDLVVWDSLAGGIYIERNALDFLPLPGNLAVIEANPLVTNNIGTYVPVLVLSKPIQSGETVMVQWLGCFVAERNGRMEYTLVAFPEEPRMRSMEVTHFVDFITDYDPARNILQDWLLYYRPSKSIRFVGWKDEQFAGYLVARLKYGDQQNGQ